MDLDAWINEPLEETDSDSECENVENLFVQGDSVEMAREKYQPEPTEEEKHKVKCLVSVYVKKAPLGRQFCDSGASFSLSITLLSLYAI